jgi:hypothetical protein
MRSFTILGVAINIVPTPIFFSQLGGISTIRGLVSLVSLCFQDVAIVFKDKGKIEEEGRTEIGVGFLFWKIKPM